MCAYPIKAEAASHTKVTGARTSSAPTMVTVTAGGSANTYGTYASIGTTPTDRPTVGIVLHQSVSSNSGQDRNMLVTLRTVSGTGTIIVQDFYIGCEGRVWISHFIPVRVPPNTAVYAGIKCATASATVTLCADFCTDQFMGGQGGFGRMTSYGVVNSGGTQVISPVTANTYTTTPVELTASTTYPIKAFYLSSSPTPGTAVAFANFAWKVMVGGAGSEQILATDRCFQHTTSETSTMQNWPQGVWTGADVPAGSRLSAAVSSGSGTAVAFGMIVHGVH